MYVIDVIPITARTFGEDSLTYFYAEDIPRGAIVSVPLGKKEIKGLVIESKDARGHKQELRKSDFSIKKILRVLSKSSPYSMDFFEAAGQTALMYAAKNGEILNTLLSKSLLTEDILTTKTPSLKKPGGKFKETLVENTSEKRVEFYIQKTLETLDKGQSVLIVTPTTKRADDIFKKMAQREVPIHIIHSALAKKKFTQNAKSVLESAKPVVLVGTPMVLPLAREDLGLVVIENSESGAYETIKSPPINLSFPTEKIAEIKQTELIRGDIFHGVETKRSHKNQNSKQIDAQKVPSAKVEVVDMREDEDKKNPAVFISKNLKEKIDSLKKKEEIFIYAPRRGLSGVTTCADCGQTVLCNKCQSPVVLHLPAPVNGRHGQHKDRNKFVCHACGSQRSAHETCRNCGSWKLKSLGLGIDGLKKDILKLFPDTSVYEISQDKTPTNKKIESVLKDFESTGGILLGTQKALPYLPKVKESVIASFDALLYASSYGLREEIMRLSLYLLEKTQKALLIQNRTPENELLEIIKNKDLETLHKKELNDRKEYGYPPFKTLIKISSPKNQSGFHSKLLAHLSKYNPLDYESLPSRTRTTSFDIILLKLPPDEWPDKTLYKLLSSLSPTARIEINPRNIF